jgi:hypothetical protein
MSIYYFITTFLYTNEPTPFCLSKKIKYLYQSNTIVYGILLYFQLKLFNLTNVFIKNASAINNFYKKKKK